MSLVTAVIGVMGVIPVPLVIAVILVPLVAAVLVLVQCQ